MECCDRAAADGSCISLGALALAQFPIDHAMASQELAPLLAAVYSPSTPPDQKRAAEAALQQLAATPQALEWALGALSNAAAPGADLQALFFACSVADEAVAFRWARLEAGGQAALRSALWRAATEPGGPHFVRQKAAAALAHVACLDWPERLPSFWPDLQTCLADPARRACGVDLLAITLEHFHTLAQTTSAGLKGRVRGVGWARSMGDLPSPVWESAQLHCCEKR